MHRVDVEDAKSSLDQLLAEAQRGEEVVLTRQDRPIARLVAVTEPRPRPRFGSARGLVRIAADFEAPLADFDEYRR
jgi:antitoxin (DNA-binding transcriptional repressor) of toxin-antitoxin stability system